MRYRHKPTEVECHPFKWGDEDGVINSLGDVIPKQEFLSPQYASIKYPGYASQYEKELENRGWGENEWRPFVKVGTGVMIIEEGDLMFPDLNGCFLPIPKEELLKEYEPVNDIDWIESELPLGENYNLNSKLKI